MRPWLRDVSWVWPLGGLGIVLSWCHFLSPARSASKDRTGLKDQAQLNLGQWAHQWPIARAHPSPRAQTWHHFPPTTDIPARWVAGRFHANHSSQFHSLGSSQAE
ncbi:hypothetical protein B0T19DRAFT_263226 [Cercophora scortea]|uniref:Uncharacterized protein n=1 Tax=Cercophora scortea TaxID=314031 RepID=A0AAE0IA20_9PEZI|nr:hypothetical protein B0T19DRAFT_263226 [Cercophora scortea]